MASLGDMYHHESSALKLSTSATVPSKLKVPGLEVNSLEGRRRSDPPHAQCRNSVHGEVTVELESCFLCLPPKNTCQAEFTECLCPYVFFVCFALYD